MTCGGRSSDWRDVCHTSIEDDEEVTRDALLYTFVALNADAGTNP